MYRYDAYRDGDSSMFYSSERRRRARAAQQLGLVDRETDVGVIAGAET